MSSQFPETSAPVFVLGGGGFIGSQIVQCLEKHGSRPVISLTSLHCDLSHPHPIQKLLREAPAGYDVVFCSAVHRLPGNPIETFDRNVAMARNFVDAAERTAIRSVIYLSSTDVYGRPPRQGRLSENSSVHPNGSYGLSKFVSEQLLASQLSCPVARLRLPGVYGRGENRSLLARFAARFSSGLPVQLVTPGTQLRDLIHVQDVAHVVSMLVETPLHEVLNLATGESLPLEQLVKMVAATLHVPPAIEWVSSQEPAFDLSFDITALKSRFPSLRLTPMAEGVRDFGPVSVPERARDATP